MSQKKRARSESVTLPPPGEEQSIWLAEHSLTLRYGSSLRLMADCSAFLNSSDEFNEVDPSGDWEKWRDRVPGAFTLFYAAIIDPLRSGEASVHCVLRAVLDGWPMPTPPHNSRLVIDYVACRASQRGRGHASRLVKHVRQACLDCARRANCYVLALEDSCPFWVDRGFVLEESAQLNARLNVFPDVHLLRVADDPIDEGSATDLALAEEMKGQDEPGETDADGSAAGREGGGDAVGSGVHAGLDETGIDEDAALQTALALSLASTIPPSLRASPSSPPGDGAAVPATSSDDDDERAMEEAIALSLLPQC